MPVRGSATVVDQELVGAARHAEDGALAEVLLLLMMRPVDVLLPPELQDLAVRVRVLGGNEGRARGGAVLGHQAARLEPDPAGIAQRLRPHRAGPPLGGLLGRAVEASPGRRVQARRVREALPFLHGRGSLGRLDRGEVEEAGGPVARGRAGPLAPGLGGEGRLREENRGAGVGVGIGIGGGLEVEELGPGQGVGAGRLRRGRFGSGNEVEGLLEVLLSRERVLHEIRQPFKLRQVVVLQQRQDR